MQFAGAEAGLLAADEDLVPGAGRVADAVLAQNLLAEPALGEVIARFAGLFGVPEVGRVVGGGAVEELLEATALLTFGLCSRVLLLTLELDPVAVGEHLDRIGEAETLFLLDELDHVAADTTAEAVVELFLRVDRERGRALVVEGAEADHPGARAAQVGVGRDHLDDVGGLLDPFQALRGDQRH